MSNAYDWTEPAIQAAAVEFTLTQCGPPQSTTDWEAKVKACARAMEAPWRDLLKWCRNDGLKPESLSAAAMDSESLLSLAAAPDDELAALMKPEGDTLNHEERMRLAAHLDSDFPVTGRQRATLAGLLRGSAFATRADVFRSMLGWITETTASIDWRVRRSWLTVPSGGSCEDVEVVATRAGKRFSRISRNMLVVRDAEGRIVVVRLYARRSHAMGNAVAYRQLIPRAGFAEGLIARKLAILSSFVNPTGFDGRRLAREMGESKASVSYHRKAIARQYQEATDGRAGWRGLRNQPQRNKGRGEEWNRRMIPKA